MKWTSLYFGLRRMYNQIKNDPHKLDYMDSALTPVTDEEESREIFQTSAAQAYLEQKHRLDRVRKGAMQVAE